jgi:chromosome segregation protein
VDDFPEFKRGSARMSLDATVNTPSSNAMNPAAIGQLWDNAGHNLPDFQRLVQMAKSMSAMMQEMETLLGKGAAMTAAAQSAQSETAAEPDGPADHARRVYRERRRRLDALDGDAKSWRTRAEAAKAHVEELAERREEIALEMERLASLSGAAFDAAFAKQLVRKK